EASAASQDGQARPDRQNQDKLPHGGPKRPLDFHGEIPLLRPPFRAQAKPGTKSAMLPGHIHSPATATPARKGGSAAPTTTIDPRSSHVSLPRVTVGAPFVIPVLARMWHSPYQMACSVRSVAALPGGQPSVP